MRQELQHMIEKIYRQYVKKKRWHKVVMVMAAIVVFCTTYALVLPAITMETVCGMEEHTHEAACYANEDMEGLLVCVVEEHIHQEGCYEKEKIEENSTIGEDDVPDEEVVDEIEDETVDKTEEESAEPEVLPENDISDSEDIEIEEDTEETLENSDELDNIDDLENTDNLENSDEAEQLTEVLDDSIQEESVDNDIEELIELEEIVSESKVLYGVMPTAEGDEITWELIPNANGSYTLKVSGNGAIPDNFIESVPKLKENANNITDILIGRGITSIGQYAFYKLTFLMNLNFEDNSELQVIGGGAFAQCYALENIELQKCLKLKIIEDHVDVKDNGVFAFAAIKDIQFPKGMTKIGTNAFYHCAELKNLSISQVETIGSAAFGSCTSLQTIEITDVSSIGGHCFYYLDNVTIVKLKNVDSIGTYAFQAMNSLTTVKLDNVKALDTGAFKDNPNLTEIDLKGITTVGLWAFQSCPNLVSLKNTDSITLLNGSAFKDSLNNISQFNFTKDMFPALTRVGTGLFEGNKFEKLTIGETMPLNIGLFSNSSRLEEVKFETKFNTTYDLFTGSTAKFKSIISSKVDEFYGENLKSISPYTSSLHFEGPSYLKITSPAGYDTGFPTPLNDLNGDYYADSQGVLYQLNADGTATLKYCPPELETYNVLLTIQKADGSGNYTVTSVDKYAFALATDLSSLNGKSTKEEAATELNVILNLVEGNILNAKIFANTLLDGEIEGDNSDDSEGDYELPTSGTATRNPLSYSTTIEETIVNDIFTITTSDGRTNVEENDVIFKYLTGENNNTFLQVSPKNVSNISDKVIRIYLTTSAPGLEFELKTQDDEGTFVYEGHTFKRKDLGNGNYYIDLPPLTAGDAYFLPINFTYPSPETPGGTVYLWGEILSKSDADKEINTFSPNGNYHKMIWITNPDEFQVTKESNGIGKLVPSNSATVVSGLSFDISANRTNDATQKQNFGEDFVKTFEYVDIMTLPEGISWRTGLLDSLSENRWKLDGTQVIVTLADGTNYILADYVLTSDGANNVAMDNFTVCVNDDDKIEFHWTVKNTKTDNNGNHTETEIPKIKLNIGNDVLFADLNRLTEGAVAKIINQVSLTPHYTYQQTSKTTAANTEFDVDLGRGTVSLTKTHDRTSNSDKVYWGEDVNYTVTLKNESVLTASGYGQLVDTLDQYSYIKAENMQKMFDADIHKKLSIQITNATLYEKSNTKIEGTAVDGSIAVILKPQDTGVGVDNYYSGMFRETDEKNMRSNGTATITFQWVSGFLTMSVDDSKNDTLDKTVTIGDNKEFTSIATALDSIGYTLTSQNTSQYITIWDLTGVELTPGEVREYKLPATVKNTFMLLSQDLENSHYLFNSNPTIINNVVLKNNESKQVSSVNTNSKVAHKEIIFTKTAKSGEKDLAPDFGVKDGSVLDYVLNIAHTGKGQYGTLPVVDHMQGGNVLLASVKDNVGAEWAEGLPVHKIDGEDYYVLNQTRTYNRVKLGNYWASDVKVTENTNGLDTIIHWYFVNTPKNTYTMTVAYKALVSREYTKITTARFQVNNESWLNDHQSHRLYASMNGNGSVLTADKKIYIPSTGERLTHSQLEKNSSTVTYELTLYNNGTTSATVSGADIYDALPNTYNSASHPTFEWTKGTNVNVSYSSNVVIENKDSWTITNTSPESEIEADGQFYLCWDKEAFRATIPGEQALTITVVLQFPTTDTEWDKYVGACNGNILQNTFYVYHMPTHVTHDLKGESRAKLQKGVYDIAQMSYGPSTMYYLDAPYSSTRSRTVYGNRSAASCVVTYYVVLLNDGTNRLYLNPIEDRLPNGFRLYDMVSSTKIEVKPNGTYVSLGNYNAVKNNVGGGHSCPTEHNSYLTTPMATINKENINYIQTNAKGTVVAKDGENYKLNFTFSGGELDDGHHYDSEREQYYLLPGEAIRFGYSIDTNEAKYTEDIATNTIMMPFTDYTGSGLNISSTEIEASDANGLTPNDGTCAKITDAKAATYGFVRNDNDTNNQWLASEVTVTRGEILPGIRKTAVSPNAKLDDQIDWEIAAYSDGDAPIIDYIITDEIESPYKFIGDVFFEIYTAEELAVGTPNSGDGKPSTILSSGKDEPMFTILSNEMDDGKQITLKMCNGQEVVLDENNKYSSILKTTVNFWNVREKKRCVHKKDAIEFSVSFKRNENGNQILQIKFEGSNQTIFGAYLGIPAGGCAKLKLSTINDSGYYFNKVFNNNAWITPIGEQSDFDAKPTHGNFTMLEIDSNERDSVMSNAIVNVSSGIFTTSEKSVTEVNNFDNSSTSNTAKSTDVINYILLKDKNSTFRYDLSVTTPKDHTMSKFVLIDNLPQVGDYTTFGTAVKRQSEFDVSFAPETNVSVKITDSNGVVKVLTADQYEVAYSSNTVSKNETTETSFSIEDWNGTSDWVENLSEFWDDENKISPRSIRLVIDDQNLLTTDSTITLSFDAVITDPNAEAGMIAWNSFGYHYEVNTGGSIPTVLEAAPLPVGIKFPAVPKLKKELKVINGNDYKSNDDETFSFLIYKGNAVQALEGIDISTPEGEAQFHEQMVNNEINQYFIQEVTVPKEESASATYLLSPMIWYMYDDTSHSWTTKYAQTERWPWEEKALYTVVELPFESTKYEFGSMNDSKGRSYSFEYQSFSAIEITAVNNYRTWELILSKADATNLNNKLSDAAFGLYTPKLSDAELYNSDTVDKDIALLKQSMGIEMDVAKCIEVPGENEGETVAYYLKKIVQTRSEGVCSLNGLIEETYILKELRAPNGYYLDDSLCYVSRDEDYYVEYIFTNEPGYALPESGSIGISGLTIGGIALMMTAVAGALLKSKKESKKK